MINICVEMGLEQCRECYWAERGQVKKECWVSWYENVLTNEYIKLRAVSYVEEVTGVYHYNYHNYFIAALQRHPEMLAVYEKLLVLV